MSVIPQPKQEPGDPARDRKSWEPMRMVELGHVGAILQGGVGKLSIAGGDTGESRKQRSSG